MAEYTDLYCNSPLTARATLDYLRRELADDEEAPNITAHVEKSTLRITYHDMMEPWEREGWDKQVMGFRDGFNQGVGPTGKEN